MLAHSEVPQTGAAHSLTSVHATPPGVPSPTKPTLQAHENAPTVLVQLALVVQGFAVAHSLTSAQPPAAVPSPEKPSGQAHENAPSVLVHDAPRAHAVPAVHSLTSVQPVPVLVPSPVNPVLHVQVYAVAVSAHTAFATHGFAEMHSFTADGGASGATLGVSPQLAASNKDSPIHAVFFLISAIVRARAEPGPVIATVFARIFRRISAYLDGHVNKMATPRRGTSCIFCPSRSCTDHCDRWSNQPRQCLAVRRGDGRSRRHRRLRSQLALACQ